MQAILKNLHEVHRSSMECPNCTADEFFQIAPDQMECRYCGTLLRHETPICGACGHENTLDAQRCATCGEPLNIVAQVLSRHGRWGVNPIWMDRVRSQASAIRALEASASEKRMQLFSEIEQRREMAYAEAQAARRVQDRRMLLFGCILTALFVVVVAAVLIRALSL
jgi:hypothetical protein